MLVTVDPTNLCGEVSVTWNRGAFTKALMGMKAGEQSH